MKRFRLFLFVLLSIHLAVSFVFVVNPPFLRTSQVSRLYRKYFLPGPFFRDDRIVDNYSLYLSWKKEGRWSAPTKLGEDALSRYRSGFSVTDLYRSDFERALFMRAVYQADSSQGVRSRAHQQLESYIRHNYLAAKNDSVRMVIINRRAVNGKITVDTVYQFTNP